MRKLTVIFFLLVSLTGAAQTFDTLYTRGSDRYMLVPVDREIQIQRQGGAATDVITGVLVAILGTIIGLSWNSVRKGISKLNIKVDILSDRVDKLDSTVKAQTITVMDISLCNNVMSRIDFKIQQSLEYLDRDDLIISSFILKLGQTAKECIQWAIHNKLKVTEEEARAKFELMNIDIRDLLTKTPANFSVAVRPQLKEISKHHVNRVVAIITDELFNSRLDRYFTLTEQTVNELITTVIRTRIENKMK